MHVQVLDTDVLVIGGGAAGARCAIHAAGSAKVILLDKSLFGYSGSSGMHPGWNMSASISALDSPERHFQDTMKSSCGLANPKLVRILAEEATGAVLECERHGAIFRRDPSIVLHQPGGHSVPRAMGPAFMWMESNEARRMGVKVLEETMATKLLVSDGKVTGATAIDLRDGGFKAIKAKSIVLATGGGEQIFGWGTAAARSPCPIELTGDGYAMGYEAGAELVDMEFNQSLLGLMYPPQFIGATNISTGLKDGFIDSDGKYWLKDTPIPKITRAMMIKEILQKIEEGKGSPHGGILFDSKVILPTVEKEMFTRVAFHEIWKKVGCGEILEVYPNFMYFMGGIKIDERCETNVKGLFACGEAAGGIHGANRLGTNSFTDCLVFGSRAGTYAARSEGGEMDWDQVEEEKDRIKGIMEGEGEFRPYQIRQKLQRCIWENGSFRRNEVKLRRTLREIRKIGKEAELMHPASTTRIFNYELVEAIECYNMLMTAEMVVRAALLRRESRGSHQREDYPLTDDNWATNILIWKGKRGMVFKKGVRMDE